MFHGPACNCPINCFHGFLYIFEPFVMSKKMPSLIVQVSHLLKQKQQLNMVMTLVIKYHFSLKCFELFCLTLFYTK